MVRYPSPSHLLSAPVGVLRTVGEYMGVVASTEARSAVWGPPPPARWAGWPAEWDVWWDGAHTGLVANVSIAFAATDLNARSLAQLPVETFLNGFPIPNRSWAINPEPLLYSSWGELITQVSLSLDLRGNAYLLATQFGADGYPLRFMVLDPDKVTVEGQPPTYRVAGETMAGRDICHIRHLSWPGQPYGLAPLEALARTMGVSCHLEAYADNLLNAGGVATTILKHPGKINQEQALELQAMWVNSGGIPGAPRVLSANVEYEVIGFNPTDLAMLDLKSMTDARIATVFGVPPPLLGMPGGDSITYSTFAGLLDMYWRATLRARAVNITRALSNWALPRGHTTQLNEDRFVRPQIPERAQAYSVLVAAGILTPDEARALEGYPARTVTLPAQEGAEEVTL